MRGKAPTPISKDARAQAVASLRRYLEEHMDLDVGDLKAELLLDFVIEELGPTIYNQAIADARAFFEERAADLEGVCYQSEFPYWTKR